jgi:hypothetical protein
MKDLPSSSELFESTEIGGRVSRRTARMFTLGLAELTPERTAGMDLEVDNIARSLRPLITQAANVAAQVVSNRSLRHALEDKGVTDADNLEVLRQGERRLAEFANYNTQLGVEDTVETARLIPPTLPQHAALEVITSPVTLLNIQNFAADPANSGVVVGEDDVIRYDPEQRALRTDGVPQFERGCPLTKHEGQPMREFFPALGTFVIKNALTPEGEPYWRP